MAQGPGRPGPVPGAGRASAAPPAPLLRPHEIDQSPGQAGVAPRQKMQQARRDLEAGQVDTDLHATPGLVGQIIDILIDNALRHGRGVVTLTLHDNGVSIADEGRLDDDALAELFRDAGEPARPHGRGLVLARRLAQADGGGVQLESSFPTRFSLRYPPAGQA